MAIYSLISCPMNILSEASIDQLQGVIQHATINNLAFGRNIEETKRVLQALKYVQVRARTGSRTETWQSCRAKCKHHV